MKTQTKKTVKKSAKGTHTTTARDNNGKLIVWHPVGSRPIGDNKATKAVIAAERKKSASKPGKNFSAIDIAMDKAAAVAAKELAKVSDSKEGVAEWYSKHFLAAGYKRLTKVLWAHCKTTHDYKTMRKPSAK